MTDTVKGNYEIIIQPGDVGVSYTFTASACSSAIANDGNIPFGTTVQSAAVTALKDDGTAATGLVTASSESDDVITVTMAYPSTGAGRYHLKFLLTLDNGTTIIEEDYNRVRCVNL